jgi:hypothetical protein
MNGTIAANVLESNVAALSFRILVISAESSFCHRIGLSG